MGGCIPRVFGGVGGPAFVAADCDGDRECWTGEEGGGDPEGKREENPKESGSGEEGGDRRSARGN